jgi:hypothetical protein
MADLSEVTDAIRDLCAQLIYPDGLSLPSIINAPVKIYSGWPVPKNLDDDLANGISHVNVFADGKERSTTRFLQPYTNPITDLSTITLTVSGNTVTIGGVNIPNVTQFCTIIVNNTTYSYAVLPSDTLANIAIQLSLLIPTATVFGAVITIGNAYKIIARVGAATAVTFESKRQEKCFLVQTWCPTFDKRDALAKALDTYLPLNKHFELYDQIAKMVYAGCHQLDESEKQKCYRRILYFNVEYATQYDIPATIITSTDATVDVEDN